MRSRRSGKARPGVLAAVTGLATVLALLVSACTAPGSGAADSGASGLPDGGLGALTSTRAAAPVPPGASGVSSASDSTDDARRAIVSALVATRATALAARDKRGWLATVSDLSAPFAAAQAEVFDRMTQLPITGYRAVDVEVGPPMDTGQRQEYGDDAWVASVDLAYRFSGFDTADRTFHTDYVVAARGRSWDLAGAIASSSEAQPWDLAPLTVQRSATTLVVGNAPAATERAYLALGDAAHRVIAGVWGSARPSVIVAPSSTSLLAEQLRSPSTAGFAQVAAITDGPLSSGGPAGSDRVYVNPDAFDRLNDAGRREVITHELTHVTVRGSTTRAVPTWLSEGFADYVGYTTVDLPATTVASELMATVRAGKGPTSLPADADFDPANGAIAPVYNEAWLAVTRMVQRYGVSRTVQLYRQVAGGLRFSDPVATPAVVMKQAFPTVLGESEDAFTADWLAYLRQLAG